MMDDLTYDAFLGGRLHLWQPASGYRAGIDPVLLAASVPARSGQRVLELGCGVGTAILCLGTRIQGLDLVGVERHAPTAELARRNGADQLEVHNADLATLPAACLADPFDHVLANPPYFDRGRGHPSQHGVREAAMGEDTPLTVWMSVAARRLRQKGYLHMIHRAERLPDILTSMPSNLGSIEVQPIAGRAGRQADRLLIRARKGGKASFVLHAPLILHEGPHHIRDGESYAEPISAVLRQGAALKFGGT